MDSYKSIMLNFYPKSTYCKKLRLGGEDKKNWRWEKMNTTGMHVTESLLILHKLQAWRPLNL